MFQNQTQQLSAFASAKTVPQLGQMIAELLGNCQLPLTHNGPVTLTNPLNNFNISGASFNYAVANATWVRASGHGSHVTALPASDPIGTLTGDPAITIYLPRSSQDHDPNVYSGDILQYVTVGGVNYAVGEGYLDAKIGSLKPMTINTAIKGWTKCDGGGATDDFTNLFVRGATSYGATGGSDTHSHSGSVGDTSLSVTGTIDSATTGIEIPDHPDHSHGPRDTPIVVDLGTDQEIWPAIACTTGAKVVTTCSAPEVFQHPVTDPGHTHTVTSLEIDPDPHSHSLSIGSGDNVPAYIEVVWYVRTGPGGEIT